MENPLKRFIAFEAYTTVVVDTHANIRLLKSAVDIGSTLFNDEKLEEARQTLIRALRDLLLAIDVEADELSEEEKIVMLATRDQTLAEFDTRIT